MQCKVLSRVTEGAIYFQQNLRFVPSIQYLFVFCAKSPPNGPIQNPLRAPCRGVLHRSTTVAYHISNCLSSERMPKLIAIFHGRGDNDLSVRIDTEVQKWLIGPKDAQYHFPLFPRGSEEALSGCSKLGRGVLRVTKR